MIKINKLTKKIFAIVFLLLYFSVPATEYIMRFGLKQALSTKAEDSVHYRRYESKNEYNQANYYKKRSASSGSISSLRSSTPVGKIYTDRNLFEQAGLLKRNIRLRRSFPTEIYARKVVVVNRAQPQDYLVI
ncbi:MAG: hypothetical protein AAB360_01040 [Patescibacteria group bacterium]